MRMFHDYIFVIDGENLYSFVRLPQYTFPEKDDVSNPTGR